MRIFCEQEGFHGFTSNRIQLLEDGSKLGVDALFGGASFSGFLIPFVALVKVLQFHMHCTKKCAGSVVLRHQRMRRLAQFDCY